MNAQTYAMARQYKRWIFLRYQFWMAYYKTGEWELQELKRYIKKGAFAIDIGGNIGVYSYHLHRLAGRVVTFEPNPEYLRVLQDLRMPRVEFEQVALSAQTGEAVLRIPRGNSGREVRGMASIETGVVPDAALSRAINVPMRRLDDYRYKNVGFIKIDVEGHEEGVLNGAIETITESNPVLLIEIEERHNVGGLERIRSTLSRLGYDGFYFQDGQRKDLSSFDPDVMQKPSNIAMASHDRRACLYINNFLFVPKNTAREAA